MREMVESLVRTTGHEVLGIADTTAAAVGLIESGRPDAVVLDLSLGLQHRLRHHRGGDLGGRPGRSCSRRTPTPRSSAQYSVAPAVVVKPDLDGARAGAAAARSRRRRRRGRGAGSPAAARRGPPTGPSPTGAERRAGVLRGDQRGARRATRSWGSTCPVGARGGRRRGGPAAPRHRPGAPDPPAGGAGASCPAAARKGWRRCSPGSGQIRVVTSECQVASVIVRDGRARRRRLRPPEERGRAAPALTGRQPSSW